MEPETRYVYRVKAVNQHGASTWSNFVRADTPAAPDPADLAPSGLEVSLVENRVTLTWDAPASDAVSVTGYEVLRRRPNDGEAALTTLVADTGNAETGYTDDSANEPGVRYTYRVRALRDGEQSKVSNYDRIDLPEDYAQDSSGSDEPTPTPEALAPSGLTAEDAKDGGVALSWTAPAEDAGSVTGYEVLRAQGSAALATLAADTGNTDTAYTDSGLTGDLDDYRYQVKALRGGDASQGSNVAGVLRSAHAGAIVPLADVTLISNLGQSSAGSGDFSNDQAQAFTTGSNSGGYSLTKVVINSLLGLFADFTVSVHENDSGAPGTSLGTLINPTLPDPSQAANYEFSHSGIDLAASTTYFIVVDVGASFPSYLLYNTSSDAEDTGGATGWSIGDSSLYRSQSSTGSWTTWAESKRISITGTVTGGTTNNAATGAPTITGTPEVGELLTADISNIGDSDGIADADFEYQWIAFDGTTDSDISGATGETYRPLLAHLDQTIKVRVSFDDDDDNAESLTSAATAAVTASTYGQVIWAATLTVEEETVAAGTFFGYSIGGRGSLEPNAFTHDGNSPLVTSLQYLEGGTLQFIFNGDLGSEDFNLYLDGAPLLIESPGTANDIRFSDHGLSWTDEQEVEVGLTVNRPATGAPAITGKPEVGETLTAGISGIMDEDGLPVFGELTYQWISDDSDIDGATDSTYTLVEADAGKTIKVRVSFTDNAKFPESLTIAATAAVTVPVAALVSNVGQTATGNANVTASQSQGQGFTTGSDSGGYTLGSLELAVSSFSGTASDITVRIYSESSGDPGTGVHTLTTPASISTPVTTFTAPSGTTLAAGTTYYVVISTTGSGITLGRTNATAEDTGGASGWSIADDRRYFGGSTWVTTTSPIRMRVNGATATTSTDIWSATLTVAEFTIDPDTYRGYTQAGIGDLDPSTFIHDGDEITVNNLWYIVGGLLTFQISQELGGEGFLLLLGETLLPLGEPTDDPPAYRFSDHGVSWSDGDTVEVRLIPNQAATGAPAITGTAQVGETLTADTDGIGDPDGIDNAEFSYQWVSDDSDIDGATDSTYTLVFADYGNTIKVRVSFTDDNDFPESLTSTAVAVASPYGDVIHSALLTVGIGAFFSGYSSNTDTGDLEPDAFTHNGNSTTVEILAYIGNVFHFQTSPALGSGNYVLILDDTPIQLGAASGSPARHQVSDHGLTWAADQQVEVWLALNNEPTGAPVIEGDDPPVVGERLTVDTSAVMDADGVPDPEEFTYQWVRVADSSDPTMDVDIEGATGATYAPRVADIGLTLYVRFSYTDNLLPIRETVTSQPTNAVVPSPLGDVIWSAKMTVADLTLALRVYEGFATNDDYLDGLFGEGYILGAIEPVNFFYDDVEFTVYHLHHRIDMEFNDPNLEVTDDFVSFGLDSGLGDGRFILYLDGEPFLIEDAGEQGTDFDYQFRDHGISWTDEQEVEVRLTVNRAATGAPAITGAAEVGETLTADASAIEDPDGRPADADLDYQWVRSDGVTDEDIDGATGSTYVLVDADGGLDVKVRVSYTDGANFLESRTSDPVGPVLHAGVTVVPADWSLKPSGLQAGDKFRLLFISSTKRNAIPTNIATYNAWAQGLAASGHAEVQAFSSHFRVVGCTAAVDARDHTGTTYTSTDKGVGIYWLNGGKAVDDYEDFYDGSWDQEANMRNESGTNVSAPSTVWTGCKHNGTEQTTVLGSAGLGSGRGAASTEQGKPNTSGSGNGPLSSNSAQGIAFTMKLYALSGVFKVAVPTTEVPADWSLVPSGLQEGDQFRLLFISSTSRNASPSEIATYNTWIQARAANGHTDIQDYSSSFQAVGSTEDMDARDNTGTTYTSSDKGVAIYWLDGNKVADDYENFYDEDWDEEASMKNESGTAESGVSAWTGSDHDGTESFSNNDNTSRALGNSGNHWVRYGRPDSAGDGPLSATTADRNNNRRIYGLSGVFEVVAASNSPATGTVTITGTPQVGGVLTANLSNVTDPDGLVNVSYSYQWIADDGVTETDIDHATGETYRPITADEDKTVKVRVSFTDDEGNPESLTSAATGSVSAWDKGELIWSALLTVGEYDTGGPIVFGFTTGSAGSLEPPTFTFASTDITITTLAYTSPGTNIQLNAAIADRQALGSGAFLLYLDEANWLFTNPADRPDIPIRLPLRSLSWTDGQEVEVRLTVNHPATGAPVITGTPEVGETLTAGISGVMAEDGLPVLGQLTYQWISNDGTGDSDISGATGSTFTPVGSDVGKTIKVRVSFTDNANFREVLTSDPIDPVGQDDWLWATTMTVGDATATLGYRGDPEAGALTSSPTFTHNSTSYDVEFILLSSNGQLRLGMDQDLPPDFQLHVGTDQFDKSDAIHTSGTGIYEWNSTGLSWSVGDTIPVWLAPVPSGPGVASVTVDQATITQTSAAVTVTVANRQDPVHLVYLRYRVEGGSWPAAANLILPSFGTASLIINLTDLTGNTEYEVEASLDSTFASGVKTASFTTSPTKPSKPRSVSISFESDGSLLIAWSAPSNDGGSAITGYTVQWKSGSQSFGGDPSREHTTGASAITYAITGLTNGTEYTVRVIAVNAVGDGPPSDTTTGTPVGLPDAPPNVQAGSGHRQLTVSWGAPNDGGSAITEYTLQWKSGGQSFSSSRQRTIDAPSRTDTIPSLDNGTEYTVRVRATTALGDSGWSAEAKGTPREGPHVSTVRVKEPISCTVTSVALEFVNLEAATEYQAHLRFRAQGSSSWTVLSPRGFWSSGIPSLAAGGALSGPSPAFTLTDLAYETTYEVQAALDSGFVDGLATTTFTTPNLSGAGLTPLSPGDGTLGLRMSRPASEGRVDGYLLQWKSGDEEYDDTDTSERQADVPGSGDREYTITGLDNGVEYTVRAMAYNDNGVGVPSSEVRGTPEAPPNSPARGAPTISGTAQVGETLTADTDGIEDDDGLADAVYSYQWLADDADIAGATSDTYTPVADDLDFEETLTSEPTAEVEADPDAPTEPPNAPRTVRIVGDTNTSLTLTWDAPDGGTAVTEYRVQWLTAGEGFANARRDGREAVVDASARSHTITGLTKYGFYQVRVLAVNGAGESKGSNTAWGFPGLGEGQYGHG